MINNPEVKNQQPRLLYIRKEFFDQILSGQKTAEARLALEFEPAPLPGEQINFQCSSGNVVVEVVSTETYQNIKELAAKVNLDSFGLGITSINAENFWKRLYPNYNNEPILVINFKK